jgi:hypothetical protein
MVKQCLVPATLHPVDEAINRIPTFREWVDHCFSDPVPEVPWDDCPNELLATFLMELFDKPERWSKGLSDERINKGIWFICGVDGWLQNACALDVPQDLQASWIRSLKTLYQEVFAKRCTADLQHLVLKREADGGSPLNSACYMLWDMGQLESFAMFPRGEHLVEPIFEVLTFALSLDSMACQESALHGLGHLKRYHLERVEGIIDDFLASHPMLDDPLVKYALLARSGRIL